MLEEEYPLPSTQKHTCGGDRDGLGRSGQSHAKVTRHIIGTFTGVLKPRNVLGDELVEKLVQILAGGRVCIFHDHQAAAGVADENSHNSLRNPAGFEDIVHVPGDLDRAFTPGFEGDGVVLDLERLHNGACDPALGIAS